MKSENLIKAELTRILLGYFWKRINCTDGYFKEEFCTEVISNELHSKMGSDT